MNHNERLASVVADLLKQAAGNVRVAAANPGRRADWYRDRFYHGEAQPELEACTECGAMSPWDTECVSRYLGAHSHQDADGRRWSTGGVNPPSEPVRPMSHCRCTIYYP